MAIEILEKTINQKKDKNIKDYLEKSRKKL